MSMAGGMRTCGQRVHPECQRSGQQQGPHSEGTTPLRPQPCCRRKHQDRQVGLIAKQVL